MHAQPGAALNFDGVNDNISFPFNSSPMVLGSNFSIEMWLKPNSSNYQLLIYPGWGCIVCPGYALSIGEELTCYSGPGNFGKLVFTGAGCHMVSDAALPLGVWTHAAVTYDGNVMKMYINGVAQQLFPRATATVVTSGYRQFGADNGSCGVRYPYNGSIDEFRVWNTARNQCEIQQYMNCEIATTAPNLTGNYHFNQGTHNTNNGGLTNLPDVSVSGVNGTLLNFGLTGLTSNWTFPGGVLTGSTTPAVINASINVLGNSTAIADGDLTPSTLDHTDFAGQTTRTFVIQNSIGGGTLNIGVYLTGPGASDFSISTIPATSIVGIGSTTLVITSLTGGNKTATVNINNNDCGKSIFDFAIMSSSSKYQAINFDGTNDYILLPPLVYYDFTIEYWMRTTQTGNTGAQWFFGAGIVDAEVGGIVDDFGTALVGSKLAFGVGNPDISIFSTSNVNTGQWVHVAVTRDNNGPMKLYINGVLEASANGAVGPRLSSTGLAIGSQLSLINAFGYFNGDVDEVRVWDRIRTQCEIQTYMNCEIPSIFPNLVGNFHFNQGTAGSNATVTTLVDLSQRCRDGIYTTGTLNNMALTGPTSNWIAAGAVATDYTTPSSTLATISLSGNSIPIVNNDLVPSTADHTDFQSNNTRTFVIQNSGTGILNLNSVTITGPNSSEFSVVSLPSNTLNTSATGTLVIAFTPTAGGIRSATINIASSNCGISLFSFGVQGNAPYASALDLDGVDDYVDLGSSANFKNPTAITAEAWVYRASWTGTYTILGNAQFSGYKIRCNGTNLNGTVYRNGSFGVASIPIGLVSSGWHHLALTYDGRYTRIYMDGALMDTQDAGAFYPITHIGNNTLLGAEVGIGTTPIGDYFVGVIDEVRFWNVVRTQCEIQSYMNCEIPGSAVGLVANYHFNQGSPNLNNTTEISLIDDITVNTGTLNALTLTGLVSNWVNPGAIPSGYTVAAPPAASIILSGNGNTINQNSSAPLLLNHTDFGIGAASSRTFVVQNTGAGTLNIGIPYFSGPHASEFSVSVIPATSLTALATTSIVVSFSPTSGGVRSASLHIVNNDCAKPVFNFAIQGSAPLADAIGLDGSNDLAGRAVLTTNTNGVTLQAKVNWRGTLGHSQMIIYNGNSSTNGYGIYNSVGTNTLSVLWGGILFAPFNYTLTPNQWTSLALVIKSSAVECYANGILTNILFMPPPGVPNGSFTIGGNSAQMETFNGQIDEVRLWDKALSQCEIQTHLDCEIPGAMPNLLGNYHFNQGSPGLNNSGITNIIDDSGFNNDLTLLFSSLSGTFENWVSPGGVPAGYTITSVPGASIAVTGNGNPILNNATTVNTSNFTDFGIGVTSSATFVIQNLNTGTLNIGIPYITGTNAAQFSISVLPASTLAALATTSFVVTFSATGGGPQNATVNINNNDCNKPIFNYAIQAAAPPASALDFDGVDDFVSCPANPNIPIGSAPYTLEAKIKPDVHGNNGIIGWGNYGTNNQTNALRLGLGGPTGFVIYNYWFGNDILAPVPNLADGNWHHIAATWNGTARIIYLDGVKVAEDFPSPASIPHNGSMQVGSTCPWCGGEFFDGKIDEVRVWNIARSECELRTFKDCEIPSTAPGLVLNYHLNQGSPNMNNLAVTTVTDASSNGIPGGLVGMALTGLTSNWVSPGSVANGYTISTPPTESIAVTGNSNPVLNNSSGPLVSNHTDFGSASTRTFVIQNSNTGTLSILSVSLTGLNASEFSVVALPTPSLLTGSATATLVIAFTPTAGGIRTASVLIGNSDCGKPIFSFAIQANAPFASALDLDGIDDFVPISSATGINSQFASNRITLEGWFYPVSTNTVVYPALISEALGGDNHVKFQMSLSANTLRAGFFDGTFWRDTSINAVPLNVWQHFAASYDQQSLNIYINGLLVVSKQMTFALPSGIDQWEIGRRWDVPETFQGKMDEIRIWNVARSQCEIQSYMNCEIPTAAPGLVANYHFNQGAANLDNTTTNVLADAANSFTGTLLGFQLTGLSSNWVSPGPFASGFTTAVIPTSSITLSGNGNGIANNSLPLLTNHTDFGSVASRSFVIQNSNTGTLNIGPAFINGANASEFSVTVIPSPSLAALASTTLVIAFTPTARGTRTADVIIYSNDCGKPIFKFGIQGAAPVAAAVNFDGVDDFIEMSSTGIPTGNNDFTVEFWVKIKSAQAGHRWITSIGSATSGSLVTLGYDGSVGNKIRIHHFGPDLVASMAAIPLNAWTHVAINYRGATFSDEIFINGTYVETINFGVPLSIPVNPQFQLGTFNSLPVYCANIDLDELRIWNRALCAPEIQNNMNCEIATTGNGLVANYHFNQGSAGIDNSAVATATDASASASTGTLTNFSLAGAASNWISPGAVSSGSSCTVYLSPEINLLGNAVNIIDGDITPSGTDNTDFGAVCINTVVIRTFSIQNLGTAPLSINSITMSGLDAASFSVGVLTPASPIAVSGSATFAVTFTATTSGVKTATLDISNSDCDEGVYNIAVTGTVNSLPIVGANVTNSVFCRGGTTTLNGLGADTYTWTGGTPTVTDGVVFTPTTTLTYTVNGTNALTGCSSTNNAVQTITVNPTPTVAATTVSNSICIGGSTTLTATGADTYTWSPLAMNGASIIISPVLTATYALNGTYTLSGCTNTNIATISVTVNALPTVTASVVPTGSVICFGNTTTLTASGANTYTWNPGGIPGTIVNPVPAANITYSLVGTSTAGCNSTNTAIQSVTVNPLPIVSITPATTVICVGASASLIANGATGGTYTWTPIGLNTLTITPSPAGTIQYSLAGTSTAGCTSTNAAVQTVSVNALPTVTASASNSVICNSATTSLLGSGADTYTWNPGSLPNATPFSPASTTTYTLSGTYTLTGCSNTNLAVQTISVNPNPTITLSALNTTFCAGGSPTLTAANAASYTWNPGPFTGSVISPTPAATVVYTLSGSSTAGCLSVNTLTQNVTVNPLPVITASASSASVCAGYSTSVHGGGAINYVWTGGISDAVSFTPVATSDYTVTGTDANACQNTATITVTVNSVPGVTANISSTVVCAGTSITLSGSGANTHTWSGGITDGAAFAPSATGSYSLTGISPAGCTSTNQAVVSVTVNPLPQVTASVTNAVICEGYSTTLIGGGAVKYTWTDGVSDNTAFSPTSTATYTVTGEDLNMCKNTATISITVNTNPVLTVTSSNTLNCEAQNATLTVSGATTYTWSNSVTDISIVVTPSISTLYTVTGTNLAGCTNTASYTQSVAPCPGTLTAITSITNVTCGGKDDGRVSLQVTNSYSNSQLSYIWSPSSLCIPNDCSQIEGLPGGTIGVTVRVTYTLNNVLVKQDSIVISPIVILNENGPCIVKIFNGFTPNGDGVNDTWQIENIEEFPKNKVMVFTRWGAKVFEAEGYDNSMKSWPAPGEVDKLESNTYFYIIDFGDGSKALKGWVELMKE